MEVSVCNGRCNGVSGIQLRHAVLEHGLRGHLRHGFDAAALRSGAALGDAGRHPERVVRDRAPGVDRPARGRLEGGGGGERTATAGARGIPQSIAPWRRCRLE